MFLSLIQTKVDQNLERLLLLKCSKLVSFTLRCHVAFATEAKDFLFSINANLT